MKLPVPFSLTLTTSKDELARQFFNEIGKQFFNSLVKSKTQIEGNLRLLLRTAIVSQPEWLSLMGGGSKPTLRGELGLEDPSPVLAGILNIWLESVHVKLTPSRGTTQPSTMLEIGAVLDSFSDVIGSPFGSYTSINQAGRRTLIPWLHWILLDGSKILIREYAINTNISPRQRQHSRSGEALMFELEGGLWQVPSTYRGVINNNFVTRAIIDLEKELENSISKTIQSVI